MKFLNALILVGLLSSCGMFHANHHEGHHKDGKSCSRDGSKKCCDKKECDRKDKSCHSTDDKK